MHVVRKLIRVHCRVLDISVEHDIAVTPVQLAIFRLWPFFHLELLDAPYLQPHFHARIVPLGLAIGRCLLHLLLDVRTEERHVGVFPVDLFRLLHGYVLLKMSHTDVWVLHVALGEQRSALKEREWRDQQHHTL